MLIPSASSLPTAFFFFGVFGFRAMVFWQIFWRRWVRLHTWKTWGFGKVLGPTVSHCLVGWGKRQLSNEHHPGWLGCFLGMKSYPVIWALFE